MIRTSVLPKYLQMQIVLVASLVLAQVSFAQESAPPVETEVLEYDTIRVTGTRIVRPNLELPTPVSSIDSEQIDRAGAVDIADVVNEIPALALGQTRNTNNFTFAQQGINALNLRGLGTGRTLVLVDSRRHVGSALEGSSAVDISNVPSALVERVDVITGGASAIYGADAVAGVVNFILKDDFEGLLVESQTGISAEGDAEEVGVSLTLGGNFANDRGNATIHVSYLARQPVLAADRAFGRAGSAFVDPSILGITNSPNSLVSVTGLTTLFDSANAIVRNPDNGPIGGAFYTFGDDLNARPFDTGAAGVDAIYNVIGSELPTLGPGNDTFSVITPEDRYQISLNSHFDVANDFRLFFDGLYSRTESQGEFSAVGSFSGVESISLDNPFVPENLREIAQNEGLTSLFVNRANAEFGNRISINQRDTFRTVFGAEGTLLDDYRYQAYYQYGLSDTTNQFVNDRFDLRWFQALDVISDPVTGQPVCRDASNGCVPLNILGPTGTIQQDALDFVRIPSHTSSVDIDQQVFAADISGPVPGFTLPAGDISMAAGVEYRKEEREGEPSFIFQEGLGYFASTIPSFRGEFEVYEAFAEATVPLLVDTPFAEQLTVEGAVRFADYSTAGSSTSYKGGLVWEPFEGYKIRGTYARAVRAPNIIELFSPLTENSGFLGLNTDPCDMNLVNQGSANRLTNCQALGIVDPNNFDGTIPINVIPVSSGGNPDLQVEEADTFTFGFVAQPIPQLSFTVDYYEIKIDDFIEETIGDDGTIQNVLNGCVDASSINNIFCDLITRGPSGNIIAFRGGPTNVSSFETKGVDFVGTYSREFAGGDLSANVVVSHVLDRTLFVGGGGGQAPVNTNETFGELGNPEWMGIGSLVYQYGDFTFNVTERYIGRQLLDNEEALNTRDKPYLDGIWYTDVQLAYDATESISVYGGVNNLFDEVAPIHPYTNPISGPQRGSGMFDSIGQYFYLGARVELN